MSPCRVTESMILRWITRTVSQEGSGKTPGCHPTMSFHFSFPSRSMPGCTETAGFHLVKLSIRLFQVFFSWQGVRLGDCLAHAGSQTLMSKEKNDCPGADKGLCASNRKKKKTYIFFHTLSTHYYSERIYLKIHKNKIPCYL